MPQLPQSNQIEKSASQFLLSLPDEEKIKVAEYVDSLLKIKANEDELEPVTKDG